MIDPETGLDAIRNVAIEGGKIMVISEFPQALDVAIDATGHVVSPGFIAPPKSRDRRIRVHPTQLVRGIPTILELVSGLIPSGYWHHARTTKKVPVNCHPTTDWNRDTHSFDTVSSPGVSWNWMLSEGSSLTTAAMTTKWLS